MSQTKENNYCIGVYDDLSRLSEKRIVCCFNFVPKVLDDGTLLKRYRKEISELKKQLIEVSVKLASTYSYSSTPVAKAFIVTWLE